MPDNNPEGHNQYAETAPASDELREILQGYADRGIIGFPKIRAQLDKDRPGKYPMGRTTLFNRMDELGVVTVRKKNSPLTEEEAYEEIVNEVRKDANGKRGPAYIQEVLKRRTIHVSLGVVHSVMKAVAPEGFIRRHPHLGQGGARLVREKIVSAGSGWELGVDGHEKLQAIGYGIYGQRDQWGKIMRYSVVPNARSACVPSYLYLLLIKEIGGMYVKITSDRGSETVELYALQKSLRAIFAPDLCQDLISAYAYLTSTRNITIERSWRTFKDKLGRNITVSFNTGRLEAGCFIDNPVHRALADYLWAPLITAEVDAYVAQFNDHKTRYQENKFGPSGCSPNYAWDHPEEFQGTNGLIKVDMGIIDGLIAEHEGRHAVRFMPEWVEQIGDEVYETVGRPVVSMESAWGIFTLMRDDFVTRVRAREQEMVA